MKGQATLTILLYSVLGATALNCDAGERPYPPNHCLVISTTPIAASDPTRPQGLVSIDTDEQYSTLLRYVTVFGGESYWTAYRYNSTGVLVDEGDRPPPPNSPVLDQTNYLAVSQSPEATGTCIAMVTSGGETGLVRMPCGDEAIAVNSESVSAPSLEVTTSRSRFLSASESITLTCSGAGRLVWRQVGDPTPTVFDNLPRTVVFDGEKVSYECVGSSRAGSAVSQAVTLDTTGAVGDEPTVVLTSTASAVEFGTSVTLSCDHTTPTDAITLVEWFANGELISSTGQDIGASSQLTIDSFSQDGVYQCRAWTANNDNTVATIFLSGRAGVPGPVSSPLALPDTMSEVFLTWTPPTELHVLDPLLLRYDVYYSPGRELDLDTATQVSDVAPVLLGGGVSDLGIAELVLDGLMPRTEYSVTVRAASNTGPGPLTGGRVLVTTYGTRPEGSVESLKVSRTRDNKTLVADWEDYTTTPPVGVVSIYQAEYRDSGKDEAINSVVLDRDYSYLVVSPVVDAQDYQVRVRVGVVIMRSPLTYAYGPFSKWIEVQGITDFVPKPPPVGSLLPSSSVIAAAVATPVLIALLVAMVMALGLVCCCVKSCSKTGNYSFRKRMDSQAEGLKPNTSELSAVV